MSTPKHTPGPWIHTPLRLEHLSVHADSGNPNRTRGRICQIDGWEESALATVKRTREEIEANTRLIAAAPDLLEAANQLVDSIERNTLSGQIKVGTANPEWCQLAVSRDALRAAIAKAQGQS